MNEGKDMAEKEKRQKLKEVDLYNPVRHYFEALGYTVNSEVVHCDVTAVKDNVLVVIEMKTSLNLDVILQATQRQKISDFTYIAIPKNSNAMRRKRWQHICHLLRRLELGLLLVTVGKQKFFVEEVIQPVLFDRSKSISSAKRKRKTVIHEIQERHGDYNTGGSHRKKLVTSYRETAIQIAVVLKEHGPCSIKRIKEIGNLPDKTGRILSDNFYGWFEKVKRGVYQLSDKALTELECYQELIDYYTQLVRESE
ncbi:MAG: hypothetical protein GX144_02145 [Clostridiaceae bacterium]|nr:hypothetical protein [Clostridiaceae bacterium]